jgi:hypothetical protein
MEQLTTLLPIIATVFGIAAIVVSVVVDVTKEIGFIKKIPTKTWTIIVAIILCVPAYIAYAANTGSRITWYFVLASIIASFGVAYIASYGWDTFDELVKRFKR